MIKWTIFSREKYDCMIPGHNCQACFTQATVMMMMMIIMTMMTRMITIMTILSNICISLCINCDL